MNILKYANHGFTSVLGGILFLLITPITLVVGVQNFHWVAHLLHAIPMFLLLISLLQFHQIQAEEAGWLEYSGFLISVIGMVLIGVIDLSQAFMLGFNLETLNTFSKVEFLYSISYTIWILGSLVFGVATLRARILPRGGSWFFIIGAIITNFGIVVLTPLVSSSYWFTLYLLCMAILAVWVIGWIWLGSGLQPKQTVVSSSPPSGPFADTSREVSS